MGHEVGLNDQTDLWKRRFNFLHWVCSLLFGVVRIAKSRSAIRTNPNRNFLSLGMQCVVTNSLVIGRKVKFYYFNKEGNLELLGPLHEIHES